MNNRTVYFLGLVVWLMTLPNLAVAQEKLNRLLQERETLHQQWQTSESKKSGLFGNRTKKDMEATNEWMGRIIQKDNQIMQELEMLKDIQTTEIGYEKEDYKYIAQKAEADIVKLKRALLERDEDILQEKGKKRTYEWTTLLFFLSSLTLGWLYFRKKS
ncbi:Clp protease ClpB [Cyclobacterium jeungdonense]|uniref:Clp protease ClpB n=1 Tax=Cyclobacterium jeungdonense TaxID=708087 RepID=A0ABT8C7K4_9BACT|nr:Clp protease ClpB [Cyclobacterium jeungdonense]MDN3687583.1 Clp protease ClpB [Cyclobacterium jeungdonense]